jgi:hypothetical protein
METGKRQGRQERREGGRREVKEAEEKRGDGAAPRRCVCAVEGRECAPRRVMERERPREATGRVYAAAAASAAAAGSSRGRRRMRLLKVAG